jgi:uncharacterized protein (TIGR02271 family)
MRTIVALYDDFDVAKDVVEDLVEAGFKRENISLMANDAAGEYASYLNRDVETVAEGDVSGAEGASFGAVVGGLVGLGAMLIPGVGPVIAAGPLVAALVGAGVGATAGAVTGGITASLVDLGVDNEYAGYYAEGVRRGGTLVVAHAEDTWEDKISDIMSRHDPVDMSTRASTWKASGWSGFEDSSQPYTTDQLTTEREQYRTLDNGDEARLQVVEEELKVGKRDVEKGGVRAHTYVTEKPVEEQVHLREEHVSVERHPVDRPATEADFITGDQSIEVTEMAEEAVVSKEARVVEEVVVKKEVEERDETIRDTVRRKDVQVEPMGAGSTDSTTYQSFESYNDAYRAHYDSAFANGGHPYDYYVPAYRYGYMLATDPRYTDYQWDALEPEMRRNWEDYNKDTWDEVKDAIRHAWNQLRNIGED